MTQETLKQMYQLLLTEPHAPTVCAQLERIAREALADHAMSEVQRLGQEIEQEPVFTYEQVKAHIQVAMMSTTPPQRKPLTEQEIGAILEDINAFGTRLYTFARAIEAAHGIKENT
jgi:hypothetical protein